MAQQPTVFLIHASDAPQHVGKLQEILQKLQAEHRIAKVVTLKSEDQLESIPVKAHDMMLVLLTHELERQKAAIENMLKALKSSHPEVKVAEVIVDHVPYENEFITFPSDLRPVRDREDMDAIWAEIAQSLKNMFPVIEKPSWHTYLKYAIPIIIILVVLVIWKPWSPSNNGNDIPKEQVMSWDETSWNQSNWQ